MTIIDEKYVPGQAGKPTFGEKTGIFTGFFRKNYGTMA
jgi:hypothetical protein